MTKKELSRIYYLQKELNMWEKELAGLQESIGAKSPSLSGMPTSHGGDSSPTEREALELADYKTKIEILRLRISQTINEIQNFIASIDDSLIRQIVNYRCIKLYKWEEVATRVGGGNTADGLRKIYTRFISSL